MAMGWCGAAACVLLGLAAGCAHVPPPAPPAPPVPEAAARSQLAPSGTLRVAMLNLPAYITPGPGPVLRGPAADVAAAMAQAAGLRLTIIRYHNIAAILADARTGAWDIAFMGHEPSREAEIDYAGVYLHSDNTFMVRADSPLRRLAQLDHEDVRIATVSRSSQEVVVKSAFPRARVISFDNNVSLVEQLSARRVDAVMASRAYLVEAAARDPAFRVLEENTRPSRLAMVLPKGRPEALRYASGFVRHAKASGLVARALERAHAVGLRGPD